ncbi:MAG: hypothetical protein RSB55_04685 [Oscillospiraceae bacterium]
MKKKMRRIGLSIFAATATLMSYASAGNLSGSAIVTGTKSLLSDASTVMVVLCPIAGALAAGYCLVRKSMSDENDGKMWTKRMTVAIGCGVGGLLISGVIAMISGYYQ